MRLSSEWQFKSICATILLAIPTYAALLPEHYYLLLIRLRMSPISILGEVVMCSSLCALPLLYFQAFDSRRIELLVHRNSNLFGNRMMRYCQHV